MIWCQGGNPRSARLAVESGWWYGFRSDSNHYAQELGPVALLDSHWEMGKVDWPRHLKTAAEVRPWLATVPDTMTEEQLPLTLAQAEELSPHCEQVLIVPKAPGLIERIPREIKGKRVVLGYSVPTSYGGTELPLWDFAGWPVHLLGGSAREQCELCGYLNVVSADGNVAWFLARRGIVVTDGGVGGKTVRQMDGQRWAGEHGHLEALRRSFVNLRRFWERHRTIQWRPR